MAHVTAAPDALPRLTPELAQELSANRDEPNLGTYWEAWEILERDFYGAKPDAAARTYGAIRGLAESFDDPYTYFLEPQPRQLERDELRGRFGGIGANIERTDEGFILYPLVDQPATRAGIEAGDLLVRVNGVAISLDTDTDSVVALIRGPVGSTLRLVVSRPQPDESAGAHRELTFEIERAEIETPSVEWRVIEQCAANRTQGETCTDPHEPRLGYIRHTLFSERSPAEMETAITQLVEQGAVHFILDLRGNPGGLVSSAVAVADLWLDGGPIYIEQRANGAENITEAQPGELAEGYALVVIVDGGSASASEIVAGALQDHNRAHLIGEQTFGKGSVQLIYELSDSSSIHVTNAEWYTPNRRGISPDGLMPDIVIEPGQDPVPQAIDLLLSGA